MRPDFAKILVERPRIGVKGAHFAIRAERRKLNHPRDWDDVPHISKIEPRDSGHRNKMLNENLSPLKRFVRSSVGRVWDEVYSEVHVNISSGNTVQQHILQHLWSYIERYAFIENGKVMSKGNYGGRDAHELLAGSIYVHPETGILTEVPRKPGVPKPKKGVPGIRGFLVENHKETIVRKDDVYMKHNGVWYEVEMRPVPMPWGALPTKRRHRGSLLPEGGRNPDYFVDDFGPLDILLETRLARANAGYGRDPNWEQDALVERVRKFYGRVSHYAAARGHQVDTKTLRRLGVANDPIVEPVEYTKAERERRVIDYHRSKRT